MTDSATVSNRHEFSELADRLREAAAAYYTGDGTELMDDASYDAGIRILVRAVGEHPDWDDADDLLTQVAAGTAHGDVPHPSPMLSLDNAMDDVELDAFFSRVAKLTGHDIEEIDFAVEPKLDGMALSVRYKAGKLDRIVTRGNGRSGEDVTAIARGAAGIPESLSEPVSIDVRGECVMTHADFQKANELRTASGGVPFANPRNAVAGSLRAKHRTYKVPVSFLAYGLVARTPVRVWHSAAMEYLQGLGFTPASSVIDGPAVTRGEEATVEAIAAIEASRSSLSVDIDGAVVKVDLIALQEEAGNGSRAPRWAIARKFAPDTRETELLDIVVAVGRTGNLSFTASLAPVAVGGATISAATLHNPSMIAAKGLRLPVDGGAPQRVVVRRAGDVIPEVVGPANDVTAGTEPFVPPTACPRCGGPLDTSGLIWRCAQGRVCAVEAGIRYAVSRDCLDIEGMGDVVVHQLVASGRVKDVADLFTLTMDDLLEVERLGEKNAAKVLAAIDAARTLPMNRVFCALGVAMTGRSMSRRLARHFATVKALRQASADELAEVEGVGPERAAKILAEMEILSSVFDRLEELGIGMEEPVDRATPGSGSAPFAGMVVVVSGSVPGMSRNEANQAVERLGGKSSGSVSAKTHLLVAGEGAGSKLAKAESLGVRVMSAEEFAELVAAN